MPPTEAVQPVPHWDPLDRTRKPLALTLTDASQFSHPRESDFMKATSI
jgi:hypothetical protein